MEPKLSPVDQFIAARVAAKAKQPKLKFPKEIKATPKLVTALRDVYGIQSKGATINTAGATRDRINKELIKADIQIPIVGTYKAADNELDYQSVRFRVRIGTTDGDVMGGTSGECSTNFEGVSESAYRFDTAIPITGIKLWMKWLEYKTDQTNGFIMVNLLDDHRPDLDGALEKVKEWAIESYARLNITFLEH
jgi:hypothetical protein